MNNERSLEGINPNEAGFGVWQALLFLILIGLIVAVAMKAIGIWVGLGSFVAAVVLLGILANVSDIRRYIRISNM
jgi:small basic protein